MKHVGLTGHSIKEIKIFRGQDPVSHMTKILIIDKDDNHTDICLFGVGDNNITVKADLPVTFTTITNILGDEEE